MLEKDKDDDGDDKETFSILFGLFNLFLFIIHSFFLSCILSTMLNQKSFYTIITSIIFPTIFHQARTWKESSTAWIHLQGKRSRCPFPEFHSTPGRSKLMLTNVNSQKNSWKLGKMSLVCRWERTKGQMHLASVSVQQGRLWIWDIRNMTFNKKRLKIVFEIWCCGLWKWPKI